MPVKTIEWKNDRVIMLDQRLLPHREVHRVYRDYQEVASAIRRMVIRGAPAIGVAAAMGVALGALNSKEKNFDRSFRRIVLTLSKTRPTAVNLFWALDRIARFTATTAARESPRSNGCSNLKPKRSIKKILPPTKKWAGSARS